MTIISITFNKDIKGIKTIKNCNLLDKCKDSALFILTNRLCNLPLPFVVKGHSSVIYIRRKKRLTDK